MRPTRSGTWNRSITTWSKGPSLQAALLEVWSLKQ